MDDKPNAVEEIIGKALYAAVNNGKIEGWENAFGGVVPRQTKAALAALDAAGLKVVPKEATEIQTLKDRVERIEMVLRIDQRAALRLPEGK